MRAFAILFCALTIGCGSGDPPTTAAKRSKVKITNPSPSRNRSLEFTVTPNAHVPITSAEIEKTAKSADKDSEPRYDRILRPQSIDPVSESAVETAVRGLDWQNDGHELRLVEGRRQLTVHGSLSADEAWFQLHAIMVMYQKDGPSQIRYSSNIESVDDVVALLHSFLRKDDSWEKQLTWSEEMRPIPRRLLPRKMRSNPPAGIKVDD